MYINMAQVTILGRITRSEETWKQKMSKEGKKKEKREKITIVLPRVIFPFTLKSKEDQHKYHTKLK